MLQTSIFWASLSIFWTSLSIFQTSLSLFGTSFFSYCPCSGHQKLMSGIWTVITGHHPCFLSIFGISLSIFWTSNSNVRDMDKYFVLVPDITVRIPDITVSVLDITVPIPDINLIEKLLSGTWTEKTVYVQDIDLWCPKHGERILAIFRTSIFDVGNMDKENCPCSGHQMLMTETWTVEKKLCPVYGQRCQNKDSDVRKLVYKKLDQFFQKP